MLLLGLGNGLGNMDVTLSLEQLPLCLDPLRTERATLVTADYSYKGLE